MDESHKVLEKTLRYALSGKGAHLEVINALEGLDWKLTGLRPDGVEHSIFQLLNHMTYWQEWALKWLNGEDPPIPEHAIGGWPGSTSPPSKESWDEAMGRFETSLDGLNRRINEGDLFSTGQMMGKAKSHLAMLQTMGSHLSYHIGQVVLLRKMLGAWPPPAGEVTW